MFGRQKRDTAGEAQLAVARQQALASFDKHRENGRAARPDAFPGGDPYDPDPHIDNLRTAYWHALHETDIDESPEIMGCIYLLMASSEVGKSQPSMQYTNIVLAVRQAMAARGAGEDLAAVEALAQYVMRYWEESGDLDRWIANTDGMTEEQLRQLP